MCVSIVQVAISSYCVEGVYVYHVVAAVEIQIPDEDDELREKEQGNIRQSGIMIIQLRSRKPDGLSHYDLYVHLY